MTDTVRLGELYDFFLNAPIGLNVLGPDGVIRLANQTDLRLAGYADEPEAYIGHRVTEFVADPERGEVQPYWSGGSLANYRATIRRRDGALQPVVIHANARVKNGTLMSTRCFTFPDPAAPLRDLPPSRAVSDVIASMSEAERGELFDLLDDFFVHAPVALHIVGPDGLVRHANKLELESLGYDRAPEEYIGHHIAEFHAEQPVIDDMLERLVGGKPLVHYPARLRHREGHTVPVIIYSSPRFENGDFVNTRCFTFPKAVDTTRELPRFGWPRNEDEGAAADEGNSMTAALKRLAGRKHAEESLGFLAEISKAVASCESAESAAAAICRLAVPFLADWCSVELSSRPLAVVRGDATGSDDVVRKSANLLRTPFTTRDGEEGALLLARSSGSAYGAADRALVDEVARRIAAAVEAARLRQQIAAR